MFKNRLRRWSALFFLLALLGSFPGAALAAGGVDLARTGSITVVLREGGEDREAVPDARITLYHAADVKTENGKLVYQYTPDFAPCGAALDDLNAEGLAEHLAGYAAREKLTGVTGTTGRDGRVTFEDLPMGLYLAVQKGRVSGYYTMVPFLITLPMMNGEGTGWLYDVEASPKVQPRPDTPGDTTRRTVKKVWRGGEDRRPDEITVHLLRDGEVYQTAVLSAENGWKHTWTGLDDRCRWSVVEADVPEDYTVTYSGTGVTITITNTADGPTPPSPSETPPPGETPPPPTGTTPPPGESTPPTPPTPELPQTGALWWPVPLLACAGILLFACGFALRERSRHG